MTLKRIGTAVLATTLAVTSSGPVMAGSGDVVGGIIGGIIGGAIVSESQRNRRTTTRRTTTTSSARAENREVQTALNYFGFPAGTPDGVMGRKSRSAISGYQAHMGYVASGQLTQYEKDFLLTSYHRAIAGGQITNQQIAASAMGPKGLLITYRDELAGQTAPQAAPATTTTTVVVTPAPAPAPTPVAPVAASGGGLPTFMAAAPAAQGNGVSLASHCNKVSLLTNSNGGFVTLASMSDSATVLNEQFCLARTYAIATGEEMAAGLAGVSPAQIEEQCKGFGPAMQPFVASLGQKTQAAVVGDVSAFALQTGMAAGQLTGMAKVCLSVGYRTDDMDVAVGSALLLFALGDRVYGELMGHHLELGFGTAQNGTLAQPWYLAALDAQDQGAAAVFAPGQPERNTLIRAAVVGETVETVLPTPKPVSSITTPPAAVPALPTFQINN